MEITVVKKFRKKEVTSATYNFSSVTQAGKIYVPIQPAIISFLDTQTPEILEYATIYAPVYGQFPRLVLITYDENGHQLERIEKPKYIMNDDGIVSIEWDLGIADTGFIILYPTAG